MSKGDLKEVVDSNNAFACDFYARLKSGDKNLFFSPFSISTCLAMAYAGARGDTATQMEKVLRFPLQQRRLSPAFKELLDVLKVSDNVGAELHIANALWVKIGLEMAQNYLYTIESNYGEAIFQVDFSHQTLKQINDWVAEQTRGKITDILDRLDPSSLFILVNAIYFKGLWEVKFDEKKTEDAFFTMKSGKKVDVPMMQSLDQYYYMEGPNFQMLGMYYKGNGQLMIIILPKTTADLANIENSLTVEELEKWFQQLVKQKVKVFIPRFEVSDAHTLNGVFLNLGMLDAFKKEVADFSGMTGNKDLYIDTIIHKALVEVNEEGTEAAAVTMIMMAPTGPPPPSIRQIPVFRADRPFIFLIRDIKTESILFMGRLMDP